VLPAVVTHRLVFQGEPMTDQVLMEIMNQVMVPLISPR